MDVFLVEGSEAVVQDFVIKSRICIGEEREKTPYSGRMLEEVHVRASYFHSIFIDFFRRKSTLGSPLVPLVVNVFFGNVVILESSLGSAERSQHQEHVESALVDEPLVRDGSSAEEFFVLYLLEGV